MRHFSVVGDLEYDNAKPIVFWAEIPGMESMRDVYEDETHVVIMYIPKNSVRHFSETVFGDENAFTTGDLALAENYQRSRYAIVKPIEWNLQQYESIFSFVSAFEKKTSIVNPLQKFNFIQKVQKFLEANEIHAEVINNTFRGDENVDYALEANQKELLCSLLQHASREDFEEVTSKLNDAQKATILQGVTDHMELEVLGNAIEDQKVRRRALIEKYEKAGDYRKAEALLEELDNFLIHLNSQLAEERNLNVENEWKKYSWLEIFEKNSKALIRSCMITEKSVATHLIGKNFDYSLCSSGYWRAIEAELNMILIDSMRYRNRIIPALPSSGISLRPGEIVKETYFVRGEQRSENINDTIKGNVLKNVMFGGLLGLSQSYNTNVDANFVYQCIDNICENIELDEVLSKFNCALNNPVYRLRNMCSHTKGMNYKDFCKLKKNLFGGIADENGPEIKEDESIFYILSKMKEAVSDPLFLKKYKPV